MRRLTLFIFILCNLHITTGLASEVKVAVAANFYKPMKALAADFEKKTGNKVLISAGSTGSLYAQIINGAPFDVFLSADQRRPQKLVADGLAAKSSLFTYAQGRLVLWSAQKDLVDKQGDILSRFNSGMLAIANPKTAPYGQAALDVINKKGLIKQLKERVVEGQNLVQTYQYISTGNTPLGFIALSQVIHDGEISEGSAWVIPTDLHSPLNQDAVLLKQADKKPAAEALLAYLKSTHAKDMIRAFGYQI